MNFRIAIIFLIKMKRYIVYILFAITGGVCLSGCSGEERVVTFQKLVKEMADRDALAEYPAIPYRSLQASSYNRESVSPDLPGWFADSDGEGFIRTEINDGREEWVMMEDDGPGCVTKIWAVCFYYGLNDTIGGNVRIYLDGNTEPVIKANFFDLVKGYDFVKPPFADVSTRAGNLYLPIPYQKGCKITLDKKAFYNIINYRSYPKGTVVETFTQEEYNNSKELLADVGKKLIDAKPFSGNPIKEDFVLSPGGSFAVKLPEGSNAVKTFNIRLQAEDESQALRSTVLRGVFDKEETIWCPVGDFFNNGVKHQPYHMWERTVYPDKRMESRWVMPYKSEGEIIIQNLGEQEVRVEFNAYTDPWVWTERSMHFHTSWRMDDPTPTFPLFDWNLLEVKGKGVFVGDQFTVLNPSEGWWGEGDEKIYSDEDFDNRFPSHFGTGTEDYYGWAGGVFPNPQDEFSKPFLGNILVGSPNAIGYNICSRTRVLDAVPFERRFKFDMESSCGTRQSWFHLLYSAASFWYALPGAEQNKVPLPEKASAKIMSLEELQELNRQAKASKYIVEGAIECENLQTYRITGDVAESNELNVWGEVSNGDFKAFNFFKAGDILSVKLTERFHPEEIWLCAIVGPLLGKFDIKVNGEYVTSVDFRSGHYGVTTPSLNLGIHEPVDNAYDVEFVYKGFTGNQNLIKQGCKLGLDYFLVKERD